jgi:hypothetical protein
MEYLHYRGEFADIPLSAIEATFCEFYSVEELAGGQERNADFDVDVEAETQKPS